MDDTAGKIQVQVKSDHLSSSLSLGHVTRVEDNAGRKDERGEAHIRWIGTLAGAVARPRLEALGAAISEFDFEGALSKLDAIAGECGAAEESA